MNSCFRVTIQGKCTYPFSFTEYFVRVIVSQFNHFFLRRFREGALFIGRGGEGGGVSRGFGGEGH